MRKIVVDRENKDRIDKFLQEELGEDFTRSKIQKMISNDCILVNNNKIKNSYKPSINDVIVIKEYKEDEDIIGEDIPLDIVYEDEDVIVVNKPSGMVVHPSKGNIHNTLVNGLLYYSKNLSSINGDFRPGIVHRIDKDTSGLLLIAKNDYSHNFLAKQLKDKTVERTYIALVNGIINHNSGTIDAPIGRDKKDRKKMTVTSENSKSAVTHFKVLERFKNTTLIECKLETGRTHQIRVHMKYINHPIVNDPVYSNNKNIDNYGQMLHAKTLGFIHPSTKEFMRFDSNLPDKFNEILEKYRNE